MLRIVGMETLSARVAAGQCLAGCAARRGRTAACHRRAQPAVNGNGAVVAAEPRLG